MNGELVEEVKGLKEKETTLEQRLKQANVEHVEQYKRDLEVMRRCAEAEHERKLQEQAAALVSKFEGELYAAETR